MKRTIEKGKPPQYTTQQKVVIALKKVGPSFRPDCSAWIRDITIKTINTSPQGEGGEMISCEGTCVMHLRRSSDGMIINPERNAFSIRCKDSKDQYGLPDVEVVSHSFTQI